MNLVLENLFLSLLILIIEKSLEIPKKKYNKVNEKLKKHPLEFFF